LVERRECCFGTTSGCFDAATLIAPATSLLTSPSPSPLLRQVDVASSGSTSFWQHLLRAAAWYSKCLSLVAGVDRLHRVRALTTSWLLLPLLSRSNCSCSFGSNYCCFFGSNCCCSLVSQQLCTSSRSSAASSFLWSGGSSAVIQFGSTSVV
jgi:hypothetical protein